MTVRRRTWRVILYGGTFVATEFAMWQLAGWPTLVAGMFVTLAVFGLMQHLGLERKYDPAIDGPLGSHGEGYDWGGGE